MSLTGQLDQKRSSLFFGLKNSTRKKINPIDSLYVGNLPTLMSMFSLAGGQSGETATAVQEWAIYRKHITRLCLSETTICPWAKTWKIKPQEALNSSVKALVKGEEVELYDLCEQSREENTWIFQRWVSHNSWLKNKQISLVKKDIGHIFHNHIHILTVCLLFFHHIQC